MSGIQVTLGIAMVECVIEYANALICESELHGVLLSVDKNLQTGNIKLISQTCN
jgi:hypothetical protein